METQELVENVKRLREIEPAFEVAPTMALIARDAIRASYHPQAIRTINALVQLVADMVEAVEGLKDRYIIGGHFCGHSEAESCIDAANKAQPIAELVKE